MKRKWLRTGEKFFANLCWSNSISFSESVNLSRQGGPASVSNEHGLGFVSSSLCDAFSIGVSCLTVGIIPSACNQSLMVVERACQLHGAIMTQHGLLHKGFHISWLSWAHWYKQTIFCLDEWPNLGYADVKQNFTCMHSLACVHTLSLCVYCNLYGRQQWPL